jgi:tetratricopeptide (TPR) repeat protein
LGVESPFLLDRLLPPHDVDLFRKLAEDDYDYRWRDGDEERLDALLSKLDGYPLAITIAANWLDGSTLETILKRWEQRLTAALNVPGIKSEDLDRLTSVDFSLALSYDILPEGDARILFAAFAELPAGATAETLEATMGKSVYDTLMHLVRRSLVQRRGERYVMLVPVREFAARSHTDAYTPFREKLDDYLLALAERWCGDDAVWKTARRIEAVDLLSTELPNLSAAVDRAKAQTDKHLAANLINALCRFFALPGKEAPELLQDGVAAARAVRDAQCEANCLRSLGDMHQVNTEYEPARQRYEEALPLYRRIDDKVGEANCIEGLGDVHRELDEHKLARQRYEEAILLYQGCSDKFDEANCLRKIAHVHESLEEYDQARNWYEEALPLFKSIGDRPGEANCLRSLGDVHAMHNEHDEQEQARSRYEEALPLLKSVGDKPREANCLTRLGNVYASLEEYKRAQERYEEALCTLKDMADFLGEGYCLASLGDYREKIAEFLDASTSKPHCVRRLGDMQMMLTNDYEQARRYYEEALPLYQEIGDKLGEARCREILGAMHSDLEDHAAARTSYEDALRIYQGIGDHLDEAHCLRTLADVHVMLTDYEQARERYEQALSLYKGIGDPLGEANCIRGLADVHAGLKEFPKARERYEEVLKLYESADAREDTAVTFWHMGDLCMAEGKRRDAIGWMEQAAQLFAAIGVADSADKARKQAETWRQMA